MFAELKSDVISCVPVMGGPPVLYLADAELTQKLNLDRASFPKPVEKYSVLGYVVFLSCPVIFDSSLGL